MGYNPLTVLALTLTTKTYDMQNSKKKFRALYDGLQYFDEDIAAICLSQKDQKHIKEVAVRIMAHGTRVSIYDLIVALEAIGVDVDYFIGKLMEE